MFGALLGAVAAPLIGGLFTRKENKSSQRATDRTNAANRTHFLEDRAWDRAVFERDRANDRQYMASMLADDRRYSRQTLASDREYARNTMAADRRYHSQETASLQREANLLADRNVQTRGLDLAKLRDQATAAGFNPLSILPFAGNYSTEAGYQFIRTPLGATTGAPMYGGGGGGAAFGGGASFGGSAGGYAGAVTAPKLSTGSFIQEAVQRGLDTWQNTPPPVDPLAEAIRQAVAQKDAVQAIEAHTTPTRDFGYDLKQVRPFKAAVSAGVPPIPSRANPVTSGTIMAAGDQAVKSARPVTNPFNREIETIPVRNPAGKTVRLNKSVADRLGLKAWGQMMVEDLEAIQGGLPAEVYGTAASGPIYGNTFPDGAGGNLSSSNPNKRKAKKPPLAKKGATTADVYEKIFGGSIRPASSKRGRYYNRGR